MTLQLRTHHSRSRSHRPQGRGAQRGVSLIEVLIVLVILVVGILTVIRLFPSGFFSIESAGTAATADGLGQALIQAQTQNSASLPDAILPGADLMNITSQYSNSDPDDPNLLDAARIIENETVTVPSSAIYTVQYGPLRLPANVLLDSIQLAQYLTLNSTYWTALAGNSLTAAGLTPVEPQLTVFPRQERFLVDLANQRIAVPYGAYTATGSKTKAGTDAANSYPQKMIVSIQASDGNTYTEYLYIPAATPCDDTNSYAPKDAHGVNFLVDSTSAYQGGWFDPTTQYGDTSAVTPVAPQTPQVSVPSKDAMNRPVTWVSVTLYRPYHPVVAAANFTQDPYQFTLVNSNLAASDLNLGAIHFNPLAGAGASALKAQISYQAYSWQIIHEDRDIPALTAGSQYISRLTLKRLKQNLVSYPDTNANGDPVTGAYTGLAGSGQDVIVLNLDTGTPVQTLGPNNDEDTKGTFANGVTLSVGHAVGRLVFTTPPSTDTKPLRIRVFYQCIGDWTAAVQKSPSVYTALPVIANSANDPNIGPAQFAFDPAANTVYLPGRDLGQTVQIDGTYVAAGQTQAFSDTIALGQTTPGSVGVGVAKYAAVDLADAAHLPMPIPAAATQVMVTSVRGLSSRAVVAWKEREHWKTHTVDTVLTRPQ